MRPVFLETSCQPMWLSLERPLQPHSMNRPLTRFTAIAPVNNLYRLRTAVTKLCELCQAAYGQQRANDEARPQLGNSNGS